MPYPVERTLGDDLCIDCPKWLADEGRPRTEVGHRDRALIGLLQDMQATGMLPAAGGLLDQDPEIMLALGEIRSSAWWGELNGSK